MRARDLEPGLKCIAHGARRKLPATWISRNEREVEVVSVGHGTGRVGRDRGPLHWPRAREEWRARKANELAARFADAVGLPWLTDEHGVGLIVVVRILEHADENPTGRCAPDGDLGVGKLALVRSAHLHRTTLAERREGIAGIERRKAEARAEKSKRFAALTARLEAVQKLTGIDDGEVNSTGSRLLLTAEQVDRLIDPTR